jgi:hypothetical protein
MEWFNIIIIVCLIALALYLRELNERMKDIMSLLVDSPPKTQSIIDMLRARRKAHQEPYVPLD